MPSDLATTCVDCGGAMLRLRLWVYPGGTPAQRALTAGWSGGDGKGGQEEEEMNGRLVIFRTYSAGVHVGILGSRDGRECVVKEGRRLWRWRGANTLHEVALHGVDPEWTRLSEPVPEYLLTEVIEVLPVSDKALATLTLSRWPR